MKCFSRDQISRRQPTTASARSQKKAPRRKRCHQFSLRSTSRMTVCWASCAWSELACWTVAVVVIGTMTGSCWSERLRMVW